MNKTNWTIFLLAMLSWAVAILAYPSLPDILPTHWGISGQVDAFGPKEFALFIAPALLSGILVLFYFLPKIDPNHASQAQNQDNWTKMQITFSLFMLFTQGLTLAQYFGYGFDMGLVMSFGLGIFFYLVGWSMQGIKKNWFFGIRTPWTLASDKIWEKTNKKGAQLFKAFGLCLVIMSGLSFYGFVSSSILFTLLMAFVIALCIWSFIYPYRLWKNEFRK